MYFKFRDQHLVFFLELRSRLNGGTIFAYTPTECGPRRSGPVGRLPGDCRKEKDESSAAPAGREFNSPSYNYGLVFWLGRGKRSRSRC